MDATALFITIVMAVTGLDSVDDVPDFTINTGNWVTDGIINNLLNGFNFFVEVLYDAIAKPMLTAFVTIWNTAVNAMTGLGMWAPLAMAIVAILFTAVVLIGIKIIFTVKNVII